MKDLIYTCAGCGLVSTHENRIRFAREWECMDCIGKIPPSVADEQLDKYRAIYRAQGLPTI